MNYNLEVLQGLKAWSDDPGNKEFDYQAYVRKIDIPYVSGPVCMTTMCYGGKLITDAGAEPVWNEGDKYGHYTAVYCRWQGVTRHITKVAAELSGLNEPEADALFSMDIGEPEENEARARDFLNVLVRRAQAGIRNMTEDEVDNWVIAWENDEEGYREQR